MKTLIRLIAIALLMSLFSSPVVAQTADDYHPFLSDRFNLGVGVFWPAVDFSARADGSDPGEEVDFDEAFNFSGSQASAMMGFRWRFGEKWSLAAAGWSTDESGKEVLDEDIEWNDIIFREGTNVGGGVGLDIVRVMLGREFGNSPNHEFGLGFGLHYMKLSTYLEGEIIFDDDSTGFHRETNSADFPLPNIGFWYMYSWSPKWMLDVGGDWLSASIGDYSGNLWDAHAGINYQAFKHIGFSLSYTVFLLDIDIDKSDWRGKAELNQNGPVLAVTASW